MNKIIILLALFLIPFQGTSQTPANDSDSRVWSDQEMDSLFYKTIAVIRANKFDLWGEAKLYGESFLEFSLDQFKTTHRNNIYRLISNNAVSNSDEEIARMADLVIKQEAAELKSKFKIRVKTLYQALDKEQCKLLKTGKFYYHSIRSGKVIITRTPSKQVEITQRGNLYFKVVWKNDAEYDLLLSDTSGETNVSNRMIVRVYAVEDTNYKCLTLDTRDGRLYDQTIYFHEESKKGT